MLLPSAVVVIFLTAGCDHKDGAPAASPEPKPLPKSASESEPPSEVAEKNDRCIVRTPAQAPLTAEPASDCPEDPDGPPELPRGYVQFPDAPGTPRVAVEITRTDAQRSRGLMYRTSMPTDEGMLFEWPGEAPRSFWMKNTCIPLDMLFIAADGTIVGILEQVPVLNERSRAVRCPAKYVLEVNAGWTRDHGVKAGQRVAFE